MNLQTPENNGYCATVFKVKNIIPLENCDNVVAISVFGFQAIVGKDTQIGDIGIVFPAETQLSDEYCYENNLYRHGDRNSNKGQTGYLEDNRRVRAVKFRGNTSSCLFMPLSSVAYTGARIELLQEGDEFDNLNGKEICRKYTVPKRDGRQPQAIGKKDSRVDVRHMPEHYSTDNFWKYGDTIDTNEQVIVTQKLHGTSIRIGNTLVKRKLSTLERVCKFFGAKPSPYGYDYVYGSRKVIKDANNPDQNHYYETDIWTEQGKKLVGILPKNYIVYAELIGWTADGAEIQKNYSYGLPQGTTELYIYRIAIVNEDGHITDLSWEQVKEFCNQNGLKHVPEIVTASLSDLDIIGLMDTRFYDVGMRNCLYLGDNQDIVDEGVCIRVEGIRPRIFKAKSPKFLEHETKLLDTGEEDLESTQSNVEETIN